MPVSMPWWSGRGLGWKIIIIYSNIGAELELISYRQDGIRPEMSHRSSSRSHHCADVSISCLLPKTILYPAVPRLGSDPHLAYLMLSHHSSTYSSVAFLATMREVYTNIYSFRTLLFFQDHFFSVLFLHFTLRSRRWEVGKWNWKLVEDTFSFCPSWERMRTLNLIPPSRSPSPGQWQPNNHSHDILPLVRDNEGRK